MSPRTVALHVRRYVKWYGLAVVWAVLMVAVPVVHHEAAKLASQPRARTIAGEVPVPPAAAPAPPAPVSVVPFATTPLPAIAPLPPAAAPQATPQPKPQPAPAGLQLPALPALPFPAVPDQLQPLLNAMSPLMTTGCSAIGLSAVVVAVVAPTVEQVPLDQLLPYLVPAYTVCALFPIPKTHTICPLDAQVAGQLPASLTSLFPAPAVMGVGIDEIAGIEAAAAQMYGTTIPSLADSLRTQLGCHTEA